MIIFDTEKCYNWKLVKFNELSLAEFNNYVDLLHSYFTESGWYLKENQSQSIELDVNRIHKKFRLKLNDDFSDGFDPKDLSTYPNGNIKSPEAFVHLLNYFYSTARLIKDFCPIPKEIDLDGIDSIHLTYSNLRKLSKYDKVRERLKKFRLSYLEKYQPDLIASLTEETENHLPLSFFNEL